MAQTDTSQTIEHLKRFLIIRLLAVMVFIFACEAIINLIVTRIMFPVFNTLFGTEPIFTNQSAGENIILQRYCGKENGRGTGIRQKAAGSICQKEESVAVRYYP